MNNILRVKLWGEEVGRLTWDRKRHNSFFIYNPEFLKRGYDLHPLASGVQPSATMTLWGESERVYQHLPAFLADSLPDDWGNQLFECWRKANHLSPSQITPLDKLAFIGKRAMGALEFEPEVLQKESQEKIELPSLCLLSEKIFHERECAEIKAREVSTFQSLMMVGTSAGGRQSKAIIAMDEAWNIRSGQVDIPPGFQHYILKFGHSQYCSAELEMTYHQLARLSGITMMPSQLLILDGQKHFLTERFDRRGNEKLHTQTLAALCPGASSYEQLMSVCRKLHLCEREYEEVFRRMVFNYMANNTDDHNKNISFIMDRNGQWRLAPAYDMTYIIDARGYLPNKEHCMSLYGKFSGVTRDDVLAFAKENSIRGAKAIMDKVADALMLFRPFAESYEVSPEWIGRVETFLKEQLNAWGYGSDVPSVVSFTTESGARVEFAHLEQAYKGNIHLLSTINGAERKYVIRKGTPLYKELAAKGLVNVSKEEIKSLVCEFFVD